MVNSIHTDYYSRKFMHQITDFNKKKKIGKASNFLIFKAWVCKDTKISCVSLQRLKDCLQNFASKIKGI